MKKLFAILAAALLVVACGGEQKKPATLEDQIVSHLDKIENALKSGDFDKVMAAAEAFDEWGTSLGEEQLMEAVQIMEKYQERAESLMGAIAQMELAQYDEFEECYEECCIDADEAIDICECEDECDDEASDLDEF